MPTLSRSIRKRRVVLTAIGSLGDLHPYIALAIGLRDRGHDAVIATSACYRPKIEALGFEFRAIRPDSAFVTDPVRMRRFMHARWGTVRIGRELIGPAMRDSYDDTTAAARGADLLVSHPLTAYATRLVSERTGVPWASTMITPLGFISAHDFPILPVAPALSRAVRTRCPAVSVPLITVGKRATRFLAKPWYRVRAEIGLPRACDANPLLDSHSPRLVLALFSPLLAAIQPDWPARTITTGFPIFDRDARAGVGLPPALAEFLAAGPPPIVFTLAWSAGMVAGDFFGHSVAAAARLGRRAVLIVGQRAANDRCASLPRDVVAFGYAPFSELFPRAAAIVHAAGVGTTGLAMRAGRPSLVVPFAHDQPDNAARLARTGAARLVPRPCYTAPRAAAELQRLLDDTAYARRASEIGENVRREDGVATACDALEQLWEAGCGTQTHAR